MTWETPEFVEVRMDAEVTAYQGTTSGSSSLPVYLRDTDSATSGASAR